MNTACARLVLAGTGSGCGKTTVTCALLQALVNRGLRVSSFKCGPDYIDPMFHSRIIGAKSANLDTFFFDENTTRYLLAKNSAHAHISVIEGVMGYYDGIGGSSKTASTCHVAQVTDSPVVLVLNARGASLSLLATIHGFLTFLLDSRNSMICGVILNQCSPSAYAVLSQAIRERFKGRVQPLGFLPNLPEIALESRHLGLVTADEVRDLQKKMQLLAAQAEKTLDIDGLLSLGTTAPSLSCTPTQPPRCEAGIRIAVARDKAFCFYYRDSLELLEEMGAELIDFSPLEDAALPDNIQGLYLGGGYPELYAKQLAANTPMLASVSRALKHGLPCIAECGGFMYLTQGIGEFPMVGYLSGHCFDTGKLSRFGYVTLTARRDNLLCRAGDSIPGHEFHYWDCAAAGEDFTAAKAGGRFWSCVVANHRLYAGYPHFHFYANLDFARNFYETCLKELSSP